MGMEGVYDGTTLCWVIPRDVLDVGAETASKSNFILMKENISHAKMVQHQYQGEMTLLDRSKESTVCLRVLR